METFRISKSEGPSVGDWLMLKLTGCPRALSRLMYEFDWHEPNGDLILATAFFYNFSRYIYAHCLQINVELGLAIFAQHQRTDLEREGDASDWRSPHKKVLWSESFFICPHCDHRRLFGARTKTTGIWSDLIEDLRNGPITPEFSWKNHSIWLIPFEPGILPPLIKTILNHSRPNGLLERKYCGESEECPGFRTLDRQRALIKKPLSKGERTFFQMTNTAAQIKTYEAQNKRSNQSGQATNNRRNQLVG